ncbi:GPI-anchored protein llg1 [Dionaea muscipula]
MEKKRWRLRTSMEASTATISILLLFANIPLSSSSSSTSDFQLSTGRKLMQTPQSCPVNFEFANYTILTSKCKGPLYPPAICCAAFKEFACPYVDEIDNQNNDCATTMFSYINLNGKYPPGLFSSECREGKLGLECPAASSAQDKLLLLLFPACFWTILLLLF